MDSSFFMGRFLLGAFVNWFIRGAGWKTAIYKGAKPPFDLPADVINALIYGVVIWYQFGSLAVAVSASIAMYAGSAPGLGEYVLAMKGAHPTKSRAWGFKKMTIRGLFLGLCLAYGTLLPALWVIGIAHPIQHASLVILAGMMQGVIYFGFIKLFERRPFNFIFNHWTCSEQLHGGLIWLS